MQCTEQKVVQHSEVRLIKPQTEERKALKSLPAEEMITVLWDAVPGGSAGKSPMRW